MPVDRVGLDTHVTATGQEAVPGALKEPEAPHGPPAAPSGIQEASP